MTQVNKLGIVSVNFIEDDCSFPAEGIEHLEIDLSWLHTIRATNHELIENYENIRSEDVLDHPFSFQTANKNNNMFSLVLDKIYYFLHTNILNVMKMGFLSSKPSYRVHF